MDGRCCGEFAATSGGPATWPPSSCCSRCCSSPVSASSSTRRASSPPIGSARRSPWRRRGRAPTPSMATCCATATVSANPAQAQATAAAAAGAFVSHAGGTLQSVSVSGSRVTVVVSASVSPWFPLMSGRTVCQDGDRQRRARRVVGGRMVASDTRSSVLGWSVAASSVAATATAKGRRPCRPTHDDHRGADDDARSDRRRRGRRQRSRRAGAVARSSTRSSTSTTRPLSQRSISTTWPGVPLAQRSTSRSQDLRDGGLAGSCHIRTFPKSVDGRADHVRRRATADARRRSSSASSTPASCTSPNAAPDGSDVIVNDTVVRRAAAPTRW